MRKLLLLICAAVTLFVALPTTTRHAAAAFPGANGRIAYTSGESGHSDVWTVSPTNPGDRVNLTNDVADDQFPTWSPDGTQIAFMTSRNATGAAGDIYIMNADGTNQRRLTPNSREMFGLSWSPDGTRIAVAQLIAGSQQDILVLNADGSGETNITNSSGLDSYPSWSPDGTQIAFESDRLGAREIYLMGPNGESPHRLTSGGFAQKPDWSPDGSKVLFMTAGGPAVINRDGGGLAAVGGATILGAAWSPDGSQIAARDGAVMNVFTATGTFVRQAVPVPVGSGISWQPEFCMVASVLSGDTFTCVGGRAVRMLQIDAPDPSTCGGDWATAAMQYIFLTPGRIVALSYDAITHDELGRDLAAPIWRGNDGADYNLSIIMAYVGLAKAAVVGTIKAPEQGGKKNVTQPDRVNDKFRQWAMDSESYARIAQWNMWAPGKPFNGGC